MTTAVILAGGLGTRLRSEVADVPKPMAPVRGRPFLEYQVDHWLNKGVSRFILSVGYKHETIRSHFGSAYRGVPMHYVVEPEPMGTGGGLLMAADLLEPGSSFLLLNGDTYFDVDLNELKHFARETRADWCFSLFQTAANDRYLNMGVAADGRVTGLRPQNDNARGAGAANGGVYWVRRDALDALPQGEGKVSLEEDLFPAALAAGQRLYGCESSGAFIDIGLPHDYRRAAALLC